MNYNIKSLLQKKKKKLFYISTVTSQEKGHAITLDGVSCHNGTTDFYRLTEKR